MFLFTYVPQVAVMAFTSGPLAALSAALLVLSESSTLFTVLSKTFLIEDALVDTFDGVLVSKDTTDLLSGGRQIKASGDPIAKLGKLITKPFAKFTPTALIRYFMYLPLNFIPVVGTVMFVVLQGRRFGPNAHSRYFQLKGWNSSQRQKHVEEYKAAYTRYIDTLLVLETLCIDWVRLASVWRLFFWRWCQSLVSCLLSLTQSVQHFGLPTWRRAQSIRTVPRQSLGKRRRRPSEVIGPAIGQDGKWCPAELTLQRSVAHTYSVWFLELFSIPKSSNYNSVSRPCLLCMTTPRKAAADNMNRLRARSMGVLCEYFRSGWRPPRLSDDKDASIRRVSFTSFMTSKVPMLAVVSPS